VASPGYVAQIQGPHEKTDIAYLEDGEPDGL